MIDLEEVLVSTIDGFSETPKFKVTNQTRHNLEVVQTFLERNDLISVAGIDIDPESQLFDFRIIPSEAQLMLSRTGEKYLHVYLTDEEFAIYKI